MADEPELVELNEAQVKARRSRNIAIAVICGGLAVLFYIITWIKFSSLALESAT